MNNLKIHPKGNLPEVLIELKRLNIDCCNYSFDGAVRVIYVSEIANEAYGAYKGSVELDYLFSNKPITLADLKNMEQYP